MNNPLKQRNVLRQEFRQVHILDTAQDNNFFWFFVFVSRWTNWTVTRAVLLEVPRCKRTFGKFTNLFGLLVFQILRCSQNSFYCPHSVIIMVLRGKLFWTKSVGLNNFLCQDSRVDETKWVKRNLGDHAILWDHHGNWSEKSFQIVR